MIRLGSSRDAGWLGRVRTRYGAGSIRVLDRIIGRNDAGQQDRAAPQFRRVVIDRHQTAGRASRLVLNQLQESHGAIGVSDFGEKDSTAPVPRRRGGQIRQRGEDAGATDRRRRRLGQGPLSVPLGRDLQAGRAGPQDCARGTGPSPGAVIRQSRPRSKKSRCTRSRLCSIPHCRRTNASAAFVASPKGPPEFTHERIDLPKHQP